MRTGVHISLGTGYEKALTHTESLGCTTVQIFTHSPRMFKFKPLEEERQQVLLDGWERLGIDPVVSHASYLINIASTDNKKFYGALNILKKELIYGKAFGCTYVVFHPGKHTKDTKEEGLDQIVKGLNKLQETFEETNVMLLLEVASGQGTELCRTFEEVQYILDNVEKDVGKHLGVCLDTCHLWAAGYDIGKADDIIEQIDRTFGMDRVKVVHVNDSKFPLGAERDRHENIDEGHIGAERFSAFLNHPKVRDLPMILETPWDEPEDQQGDLDRLNGLL